MRWFRPRLHALAGLYAIDALDTPAERRRFERHLARCGSCASEVRGLTETASALGVAAARQPPATLRPRVMAAVADASQLPALRPAGRARGRSVLLPRLAVAVAGVSLVVSVALGITLAVTQQRLDHTRAQNQAIASVLAAGDAQILTGATSHGGQATVVVSPGRRQMVVTASGLPPLPASKVYQLWLIGPPGTRSAGLLPAAAQPGPVLAAGLAAGDKFGMTVEPAGGSAQPTTTPIVVIPLPG